MCYTIRKKIEDIVDNIWQDGYLSAHTTRHKPEKSLQDYEEEIMKIILEEICNDNA